jgi:transposase
MARTRREFTKEFKLSVLREVEAGASVAETARAHEIHPETIRLWKRDHRKYADRAFAGKGHAYTDEAKIAQMERAMGQLALENALLKKAIKFLEDWRRDNGGKR